MVAADGSEHSGRNAERIEVFSLTFEPASAKRLHHEHAVE
jgi:hypothetical protein